VKGILLWLVAIGAAYGQSFHYSTVYNATVSSSAAVLTVQQPATPIVHAILRSVSIYCSVACTVQVERDGSAATATAGTAASSTQEAPSAGVLVFTGSNVGSGTILSQAFQVSAGTSILVNLAGLEMLKAQPRNYSFRTNSISGTVQMTLLWDEVERTNGQ
jgi:hypothetical protein